MTWVPPSSGGNPPSSGGPGYGAPGSGGPSYGAPGSGGPSYGAPGSGGPGYGSPAYGGPGQGGAAGGGAPQGVPQKAVKERELRRERALRALPPPPNPPPGMGAKPAFAPPVPRPNRTVLIVSLVLGATLLLCCGGGVGGVGGLFYYSYNALQDDAVTAVEGYLGDLQAGQYERAYGRLCYAARSERTLDAFTRDEQVAGQVAGYQVDDEIRVDQDSTWVLTARVSRQGGSARSEFFPVTFDRNTAEVCP